MLRELLKTPRALVYAIIGHVLLVLVLLISLDFEPEVPSASNDAPLKAVAVDEAQVKKAIEDIKRQENAEKKRKQNAEKKAAAAEKKRKQEEQRVKETQKKLAEKSRLQAAEKKRSEKLAKKRKQEEKIKQQKVKEAAATAEREAELQQQLAQEEAQRQTAEQQRMAAQNNKRLDSLRGQWIAAIKTKIENNWLKPARARQMECVVKVHIDPAGYVLRVDVSRCLADEAYRSSVERAVYKASPLPKPADPSIFDRDIELTVTDKKSQ